MEIQFCRENIADSERVCFLLILEQLFCRDNTCTCVYIYLSLSTPFPNPTFPWKLGIFLFLALVSIMEDQRRSGAGLTNPVNRSSITYPSHAQLGVNPGLAQGDQYPPGYRFKPRDQELISCYLLCKIRDRPLPRNGIHEVTLYKYSPETLAGWTELSFFFFPFLFLL